MSKFTKALEKVQDKRGSESKWSGRKGSSSASALKVPSMDAVETVAPQAPYLQRGITTLKNTTADDRLVMMRYPRSMVAEQYRMLRTSLNAELSKNGAKVILASSSLGNEGKTVSSINLATCLAENDDVKVALVDADLRRGNIVEYLGVGEGRLGLSELLSDANLKPKQVMIRTAEFPNLVVIPRGSIMKNPSELVSSTKFHLLIEELRANFDYVVIDAPPIMSVADAGIMARVTDGVVFVIQIGRTPKTVIAHAQQLFYQAGARMLGHILTNVEYQSSDYRYYDYSTYYGEIPEDGKGKRGKKGKNSGKYNYTLKKAGWNFKNMEDKFNGWWDRKILKKEK